MRLQKILLTTVQVFIAVACFVFAQSSLAAAQSMTPTPSAAPTESPTPTPTPTVPASPSATPTPFVAANFTAGFSNNQLLTLTYPTQYYCAHQFSGDLNYNGIAAQSDPGEYEPSICQVDKAPTIGPSASFEPIYVLIPMFSVDDDTNPADAIACNAAFPAGTLCGEALGSTLISLFGNLPEAFKQSPEVKVQCPDLVSVPGTCTMHTSRIDLGQMLVALKKATTATNVFVPEPNLSHVLGKITLGDKTRYRWRQVMPVLVNNSSDWPPADGSSGITSVKKLQQAVKAGDATIFPSNYFLNLNVQLNSRKQ